jgi:hypothetical protein
VISSFGSSTAATAGIGDRGHPHLKRDVVVQRDQRAIRHLNIPDRPFDEERADGEPRRHLMLDARGVFEVVLPAQVTR